MRPLVYLTVRSFLNGIKRALTSGKRLVGLLFFLSYYVWLILRPMGGRNQAPDMRQFNMPLTVPSPSQIEPVVFGLFAFMSFILVTNVMGYRGGFKPADVDVLFSTPISPRLVLIFRIVRDYLVTLLLPLFFGIIGWQGVVAGVNFFKSRFTDEQVTLTFRTMSIAWFLMALCWVSIGYAASLFVNRSDLQSDRNKKIIGYSIGALLVLVSVYIGVSFRQSPSLETAVRLAHSPILRVFFFTATAATSMVMAPLENQLSEGLLGFGGLVAVIVGAFWVAMTQVNWLYDQAAARGFDSTDIRRLRQKGDMYAILAEQARQGKVKSGRIANQVARWRPRGGMALLWKDLILQARGSLWSYAIFVPVTIFLVAMPIWAMGKADSRAAAIMFYFMQGMGIFLMSMSANSGVIEMLRRVDVQKPLPFTPAVTVFWEITAKALPPTVISWLAGMVALALNPRIFPAFAATVVMAAPLSFLLVSIVYLVTVLFPDVDDPTQRGFRSLMLLLAIAVLGLPSVAIFGGLVALAGINPLLAAIPFVIFNVALTFGLAALSGALYANFNPTE